MVPMLEVTLQKRLDGFMLDVAFIAANELVVLFGPSGAGKSLTLQAIAGTIHPDAGRIVIDNQIVYDSEQHLDLPPQVRRVGYVPQHYALFPHLTAAANIGFGLAHLSRAEREQRVQDMVTLFDLQGLTHRRPRELSGGQQQRVALARALAVRPRLLLLDEPFAALDLALRESLREELAQVQARTGITVVMVTHDLTDAFALGHRILVYEAGRVIQHGTREEVFFHPATRHVAELVGTRNILPAVVERSDGVTLWMRWQGHQIAVLAHALTPGTLVELCIRPTQILIVRPDRLAERERVNLLSGTLVREQMHGETYLLSLRVDGSPAASDLEIALPAYVYHRLALDTDKRVTVELRQQALHVMGGKDGGQGTGDRGQ
ncbi:MAG: ABC transporter ATP-binding protein [Deltaproteobacteria bacterium]|nr:ABC transporter ATP-binding protein [Deltaproteobacteria bacterium]